LHFCKIWSIHSSWLRARYAHKAKLCISTIFNFYVSLWVTQWSNACDQEIEIFHERTLFMELCKFWRDCDFFENPCIDSKANIFYCPSRRNLYILLNLIFLSFRQKLVGYSWWHFCLIFAQNSKINLHFDVPKSCKRIIEAIWRYTRAHSLFFNCERARMLCWSKTVPEQKSRF